MPNLMTHALMGQDVLSRLDDESIRLAIEQYPQAFILGTSGPDIFFYHNVYPWQDARSGAVVHEVGNRVHREKVNDFYLAVVALIASSDDEKQALLLAYFAGHLMHWALDVTAHPYIFNQSGEIGRAPTTYWHFRMESMIDALMIRSIKRLTMDSLSASEHLTLPSDQQVIITQAYQQILMQVFAIACPAETISKSIDTGRRVLKVLYDPHHRKYPFVRFIEQRMKKPWAFTSHMVTGQLDHEHDVLNLAHRTWCYPTDDSRTSKDSFVDLYEQSIVLGLNALTAFQEALNGRNEMLLKTLGNRRYDSGLDTDDPLIYYDSIYERGPSS